MPGKRTVPPNGFVSPIQFCEMAKKRGFEVNPRTLSIYASRGTVPFARHIQGRKKGLIFPTANFNEILRAVPKKAIMPEGSFTKFALQKYAKSKGFCIRPADVDTKIKHIIAGKEPAPQGLARDQSDSWHRFIIPKEMVQQLLKEAKHRKNLPNLLESGKLIPLQKLAEGLGLKPRSLNPRLDIKKIRIAQGIYVTRAEAKRFKEKYLAPKTPKKRKRVLKKAPVVPKAVERKPKAIIGIKKPMPAPMKPKEKILTVGDLGWKWFKENKYDMGHGKRMFLERIIRQNENLPANELFDRKLKQTNWQKVLMLLEKTLYR